MRYRDAVAEARRLIKRSEEDQWRVAELTYQQVEVNKVKRVDWAKDVGLDPSYVGKLFRLWVTLGELAAGQRPRFADAIAEIRGESPDPTERKYARVERTLLNAPPEVQRRIARKLDPVVTERFRESEERRQLDRQHDAPGRFLDLEGEIAQARRVVLQAVELAREVPFDDEQRTILLSSIARLRSATEALETSLVGSISDNDLARLLEG